MQFITHGNWKGFTGQGLTDRELECTLAAAAGMTNKEIARQLGIAPDTVKKRIQFAMGRLDVPRRTALVAEAMRKSIIAPLVVLLCSLCTFQTFLDLGHMHRAQRAGSARGMRGGRRDEYNNPFDIEFT
nr:helix-turn-helix transcriptional regulator [uncultured Pseudomonas sp.]